MHQGALVQLVQLHSLYFLLRLMYSSWLGIHYSKDEPLMVRTGRS